MASAPIADMSIFRGIQTYFYNQSLDKLRKRRAKAKPPVSFEAARNIGILFDATELEERETVLAYAKELRNKLKQVRLLGFFDNKLNDSNFTFHYFNRKNIDWAQRPGGEFVEEFIEMEFDWLFNLALKPNPQFEYIAALSRARLRVGPMTDNTFCYDIMIDAEGGSLRDFIQQMELVLAKTNTQHEAANI